MTQLFDLFCVCMYIQRYITCSTDIKPSFAVGRGNFSIVSNKSNRYGKKSQIVFEGQSLQSGIDESECLQNFLLINYIRNMNLLSIFTYFKYIAEAIIVLR